MKINLIEYFQETVKNFPEKVAVSDDTEQFTFQKLEHRATHIAFHITQNSKLQNQPFAIFLPKSSGAVAAFVASLYTGNCYAPLDTKNPVNRIKSIIAGLKPSCIITNTNYIDALRKMHLNIPLINIDEIKYANTKLDIIGYKKCIDTDPAYIIHTSGSTGVPKGVVISHRSIVDYIEWAIDTFAVSEKENIGNQAPFIFDNSTLDIYLMLFTGATLHLIPESHFMFPARLLDYIRTHNINFIFWVPSVLINIANLKLLDKNRLPSLKKILFAGEVMPTKQLNYWIHELDNTVLFANLYGPTEITVDCTYYIVDRPIGDDEVLPIGFPCRNTDILIINAENKICEISEHGELCVRGSSLALGYWNNFEKTDLAFIQNPLNGSFPEKIYKTGDIVFLNELNEIIFVGRKDFQIKHLGYRIELGEIEHSILSVFDLINACVLYDNNNNEIALVYGSKFEIPVKEFRLKLSQVLSKYMIPTKYYRLEHLPLTSSGKIDRVSLYKKFIEV